jgi:hypothetical protein
MDAPILEDQRNRHEGSSREWTAEDAAEVQAACQSEQPVHIPESLGTRKKRHDSCVTAIYRAAGCRWTIKGLYASHRG